MKDGNVFEVSLLGAVAKEGKPPNLLYAVTSHRPLEKINNILQISGAILGQSRAIFFGRILSLLRLFHPGKMELLYCGEVLYFFKSYRGEASHP